MTKVAKIISSFLILLSVVLLFTFKSIPVSKLWDEYIVLYVPTEESDEVVLNALAESGINNVVSLSGQYLPLNLSTNSIEFAMYEATMNSADNKYVSDRNNYFFDKSNKYRLYYIPKAFENNVGKGIELLSAQNINCGIDSTTKYPILYPVIVLIVALVISLFAHKKALMLLASIIPVIYVFCNPFYPIALSIILLILCGFFVSNLWKRKGAAKYLSHYIFIPICFVAALLCGFASSLSSGLLFIVTAIGYISVFYTYFWIEDFLRNRKPFVPVYIRPAKMISVGNNKFKTVFTIVTISTVLLLVAFVLSSSGKFTTTSTKVELPCQSSIKAENLPELEDYYKWTWNVNTYPYRSLNDAVNNKVNNSGNNNSGNNDSKENIPSVTFPEYKNVDGIIQYSEKTIFYDDDYKNNVYDNIESLQFNSIEQVLKSEGKNFTAGYNSNNSYHIDLFGIIMIIICYSILLFILFSIIIGVRKGVKITKKGVGK